jgi:hypothetical protein
MSARSKTFVGGCLGCLGLTVLVGVILAVVAFWPALRGGPDPEPVRRQASIPWTTLSGGMPPPAAEAGGDLGAVPAPEAMSALPDGPDGMGEWTVELDLSLGDFVVEPAGPGEGLSVEADYDRARFTFEQEVDEEAREVRVRFGQDGPGRFVFGSRESDNHVTLRLPRGVPLRLVGELGIGQTRAELGGLELTAIDLRAQVGDHALSFSEPTTGSLASFDLSSGVGEVTLHGVGNASPARLDVSQSLGELLVDLNGAWRGDATVTARLSLGECTIVVPEDVELDVDRVEVALGESNQPNPRREPLPAGTPRLTLDVQGSLGEVTVRH